MNVIKFLNLLPRAELECNVKSTGSPHYSRCFLMDPSGCTIARATVLKNNVQHIKWYDTSRDITTSTYHEYALDFAMRGGILTRWQYAQALVAAKNIQETDLKVKVHLRSTMPKVNADGKKIRRKKLVGRSLRSCLDEVLRPC